MKSLLRVGISLAFIALLLYLMRDDIPQIGQTLRNANRKILLGMVAVFFSTVVILARRLQLIFQAEEVRIGLGETCQLTFVGYFFNNFLPTAVGGDIVKAVCASRVTGEPVKSVTSVLMDRIFGLFTFILLPSISLLFIVKHLSNPAIPAIVYSFLGMSILCFFLIFNRNVARQFRFVETTLAWFRLHLKVRKIYDGLHDFKRHKGVAAQAMILSIIGQGIGILVLYGLAVALGAKTSPIYFYLLVPVVHLVSMLPSLNGLGIRESAYIYFLSPYIGKEGSAALGILWLALLFLLSLIGGLIYLVRQDYHISIGKTASPE